MTNEQILDLIATSRKKHQSVLDLMNEVKYNPTERERLRSKAEGMLCIIQDLERALNDSLA